MQFSFAIKGCVDSRKTITVICVLLTILRLENTHDEVYTESVAAVTAAQK